MKKGIEYVHSHEKRLFDLVVGGCFTIPTTLGKVILLRLNQGINPVFTQPRVGANGKLFDIEKFLTLDPNTGKPISSILEVMRKFGMDEFAQSANIIRGEMAAAGRRPLIPDEFTEFMDNLSPGLQQKYMREALPTKPGVLSSFGIYSHDGFEEGDNTFEARADLDLKDIRDGSIIYDLGLFAEFIGRSVLKPSELR